MVSKRRKGGWLAPCKISILTESVLKSSTHKIQSVSGMDALEYEELWFASEGFWIDQVVSPKEPWDERKPTGELVRELFDLSRLLPERKPLPIPADEAQSYLVGLLEEKAATIEQLEEEALARAQLHDESIREVDYQITKAASSLDQFTTWGIGYNTGVDIKRNFLERELSNLRKERRSTFLRAWQDIAGLRKEFREAVAEYNSLVNRLGLL